jgi:hypothetical protein
VREIKDGDGRTWQLALTVSAILRVRDLVKITTKGENGEPREQPLDLANIAQISETLTALKINYTTLGEILYAAMMPQVETRKLTRDEFLDSLRGDSLDAAGVAIVEELVAFFPQRHRRVVRLMVDKFDELQLAAVTTAEQQIAQSGTPSGSVPGSSASTQVTGPTGNSRRRPMRDAKTTGGTQPTSSA